MSILNEIGKRLEVVIAPDTKPLYGMTLPRYWYHDVRARGLNSEGGIDAYEHRDMDAAGVYLSPRPLSGSALRIDLKKLDLRQLYPTGQAEGYMVYRANIPAEAIVNEG